MTAKPNRSSRKSGTSTGKRSGAGKTGKKPVTIDLEPEKVVTASKRKSSSAASSTSAAAAKKSETSKAPASSAADSASTKSSAGSVPKSGGSGSTVGRDAVTRENPEPQSSDLAGRLVAGIVGGLIVLGGAGALQYLGYLPTPGVQTSGLATSEALDSSTEGLNAKIAELENKLNEASASESIDKAAVDAAIDARMAQLPGAGKDIVARADLDGLGTTMSAKVSDLQSRLDKTASALDQVQSSISSGEAGDAAALSALSTRMESLSGELTGLRDDVSKLSGGVTAAEVTTMGTTLSDLSSKVGKIGERLAAIDTRVGSLPENVADAQVMTSLGSELSSVKSTVETVKADLGSQKEVLTTVQDQLANGADKKAARALAAAALKSDIDRGLPFADSLGVLKSVSDEGADVSILEPYAATGIPSEVSLVERFDAVSDAVMAATTEVKDEGAITRLVAGAKAFVKVKSVAPIEGESPAAILSRIGAAVTSGDLAKASSEWATLPEAGKAASKKWHDDLQARINANALMANTVQSFMSSSGAGN